MATFHYNPRQSGVLETLPSDTQPDWVTASALLEQRDQALEAYLSKRPRGLVAYIEYATGATYTVATDIATLTTGSVTPDASRYWKISAEVPLVKTTGTGEPILYLRDGAGTDMKYCTRGSLVVGAKETYQLTKVVVTTAVAVTYKLVMDPGTNGVQLNVSASLPAHFLIEDLGGVPS